MEEWTEMTFNDVERNRYFVTCTQETYTTFLLNKTFHTSCLGEKS